MNDSGQYVVQMGDYDQNTYIIQDSNGVQYESSGIIGNELAEGTNIVTEPRWVSGGTRGGKVLGNQQYVNGDLVQVSGTGLNLNTRYTPSSIVLNSSSGNQFDQDNMRIASAVSGSGARGRPRGRKPSRGNFPVVPIDMVRQLGIEQQVILQPTVPVAIKNKCTMAKPIIHEKVIQTSEQDSQTTSEAGINTESNVRIIYKPVFIPTPVAVHIPVPVFLRFDEELGDQVNVENAEVENFSEVTEDEAQVSEVSNKRSRSESSPCERVSKHRKVDSENTVQIITDNVTQTSEMAKKDNATNTESYKLKYVYGMNAWRHWSNSKDILEMENAAINESLSLFVQQVTKPNKEPYVPDSIMYLVLGIQLYLIENDKCLCLFTDPQFIDFQTSLDLILSEFKPLLNENQTLLCRIEEDHYWEAQQLGTYDLRILLFSACYFLTVVLKIRSSEELCELKHCQFEVTDNEVVFTELNDFSKHIVLCSNDSESPKGRNFYSIMKLYLEKCAAVSDRPDCFFLSPAQEMTETGNTTDFSNEPLDQAQLNMMYNRIIIVKEVQEGLLNSVITAACSTADS